MRLSHPAFEALVVKAVSDLPTRFQRYADNVAVVIEDQPSPSQLKRFGVLTGDLLLGVYEGVPRIAREGRSTLLPDRIVLFQRNLESVAGTEFALRRQVRQTLMHELGHHLGLSETRVRAVEARRRA